MQKKILKTLIITFSCFLALSPFCAMAQNSQLSITSVKENMLKGGVIFVSGESLPNTKILLNVKDEQNIFVYSAITEANNEGYWSAGLDQPLKKGAYYIEAVARDENGILSAPVESELINVKGPFALIIGVFSFLVIILLFAFVSGWYISRSAEIKRYRRILAAQNDIIASYNILKKDVNKAIKNLSDKKIEEGKINEAKFLLGRVGQNLEKMNKYVVKGISVIGEYDIISKLDKKIKKR